MSKYFHSEFYQFFSYSIIKVTPCLSHCQFYFQTNQLALNKLYITLGHIAPNSGV